MILRYTLAWCLLLIAAMLNGSVRDVLYKDTFGELRAHQLSTFTLIVLFGGIIWGLQQIWHIESSAQAWTIGFIWVVATLAFEFLFFHYVGGKPWDVLLGDYDILEGRIWVLIPMWVTIAPYLFFRFGSHQ